MSTHSHQEHRLLANTGILTGFVDVTEEKKPNVDRYESGNSDVIKFVISFVR